MFSVSFSLVSLSLVSLHFNVLIIKNQKLDKQFRIQQILLGSLCNTNYLPNICFERNCLLIVNLFIGNTMKELDRKVA